MCCRRTTGDGEGEGEGEGEGDGDGEGEGEGEGDGEGEGEGEGAHRREQLSARGGGAVTRAAVGREGAHGHAVAKKMTQTHGKPVPPTIQQPFLLSSLPF
jgi:hypothetical protein